MLPTTRSPARSDTPTCRADQLSLRFDDFSRSGTRMVLRNRGPNICTVPAIPRLGFEDATGRQLALVRRVPPGFHPGPVVRPVELAVGGEAEATLRWAVGSDAGTCLAPASITVTMTSGFLIRPFATRMCGPPGRAVPFEQPWLRATSAP